MATNPPPRAPTFPKFVDHLVDDSDLLDTPDPSLSNSLNPPPASAPLPDLDSVSASISNSIASSTARSANLLSDSLPPSKASVPPRNSTATTSTASQTMSSSTTTSASVPVVPLPTAHRNSVIADILLWRQPKVTAIYFGSAMSFFFLTLIRGQQPMSVAGFLFAAYQVVRAILVKANATVLKGKLDIYINRPPQGTPLFRSEVADRWAAVVVDEGNSVQHTLRDMMYCDKPFAVVAWAFVGLFIYVLGGYFSFLTLAFVATLLLFGLPIAYDKNKKQIDNSLAKAGDQVTRQLAQGQKIAAEKAAQLLENAPPAARDMAARVGIKAKGT